MATKVWGTLGVSPMPEYWKQWWRLPDGAPMSREGRPPEGIAGIMAYLTKAQAEAEDLVEEYGLDLIVEARVDFVLEEAKDD